MPWHLSWRRLASPAVLDPQSGFVRNGGIMTRTCILLCYEEIGDERVGTDDPADATVVRSLGWCVERAARAVASSNEESQWHSCAAAQGTHGDVLALSHAHTHTHFNSLSLSLALSLSLSLSYSPLISLLQVSYAAHLS